MYFAINIIYLDFIVMRPIWIISMQARWAI